jgi:hypothetical protein
VNNLPAKFRAHDCREHLNQHPNPCSLMDDVQLLYPLPHCSRENTVRLHKPTPARSILLNRSSALPRSSSEEYHLVFYAIHQIVFTRQSGENIGQQIIEVDFVGVWQGSSIEDVDGMSGFGGDRRAVEDAGSGAFHLWRVVGGAFWRRDGVQGRAACTIADVGSHLDPCLAVAALANEWMEAFNVSQFSVAWKVAQANVGDGRMIRGRQSGRPEHYSEGGGS